ncbi:helix-turn-helix transcriptional regulator [Streptomyces sp. VRA16 Mangrove soil]|uniref:helix-turn-helix transcriptional regulator n=1 Tax=Streptomyces sp. VRA16 Mangrove soil TaxID=2817434 RepID=UPI001A9F05A6|nr:helix-turn-helix transcriptional regulator [Streptomyces sp. VRA16 Mangrove soil]MBO1336909.1 helix-turn-helix domain-containing protein [Streptomyces sp. VRA16 Mangrove soil]
MTTMTQDAHGIRAAGHDVRPAEIRRHELAGFLRSRRERITPEDVGLPRGPRRRTPGLRREEVAHLSAVGVTWYTWLEQARDIQVSAQVLDALARTLRLDAGERTHLFGLAGVIDPSPVARCARVTPELQVMLRQLEPFPAAVQNSKYDILAYNRTYAELLCDLDEVPVEDRNLLLLAFTNEQWRSSIVHLDEVLRTMTAKFRAVMADNIGGAGFKVLLKRLLDESAEFRELWERYEVGRSVDSRTKYFHNAQVGPLTVVHTDLWIGRDGAARLVTYTPADDDTRTRLEALHARAAAS